MSLEPKKIPEEDFGVLQGCLVEGDPVQRARERRIRRRSLVISITLQGAVLAAIVLIPLFGKTERIALASFTPVPPYSPYRHVASTPTGQHAQAPTNVCRFCFSPNAHPTISRSNPTVNGGDDVDNSPFDGQGTSGPLNGIPIPDSRPRPPETPVHHTEPPQILHVTHLDPAMLKQRIEPVYPHLALQIHKEGRVELHAIIDIDGRIRSLQVVGGDPLFYSSAMAAVEQWIYKPTFLNGQPVQVDTTITVIYSMSH
jgi:protein TonB